MKSNMDLIDDTDKFPYIFTDGVAGTANGLPGGIYALMWKDNDGTYAIGYMLSRVVKEFLQVPEQVRGPMEVDHVNMTVSLFQGRTEPERTATVAKLAAHLRQHERFKLLKGWRDELWPVYGRNGDLLFSMERGAMGLLGTVRYGVHMTAFVRDPTAPHGINLWVPKRASDKSTFPGMLDNTVAGGLMTDEDPFECIIREADEEASLPDSLVRDNAREVGTVTYIYVTDEKNVGEADFIYPECQWVYDLELSSHTIPKPKDGEVEEFRLCDVDQVKQDLAEGNFKDNCALVMLDFFSRHGILTQDNEPELNAIQRRMHRTLPFPGPHQKEWCRS